MKSRELQMKLVEFVSTLKNGFTGSTVSSVIKEEDCKIIINIEVTQVKSEEQNEK